jgi:hypothetical protein
VRRVPVHALGLQARRLPGTAAADMRITVYAPRALTPTAVHDALCLTDRPPPAETVRTWSKYELLLAYDWAIREHLAAADNPVQRRQRPSFTQPDGSCVLHGPEQHP